MKPAARFLPVARSIGILLAMAAAPSAALAQAGSAPALDLTGSLSIVSDYRFRGISNTDIGPAIQPSLQLDTAAGVFAGLWASNIADLRGANTELDLSAGWSGPVGPLDISAGAIAYLFPGARKADTVELFASAGFPLGPASATLGLNWAPDQASLGGASRYAFAALSAAVPGRPITLRAALGHEQGGLPLRRWPERAAKWDWQLGADLAFPNATLGLSYVGTDLPDGSAAGAQTARLGRDAILVRLTAAF